ncbi:MAG: hypothetical protein JNK47_24905 [Mesorhizobium sp.]|nr:hypothetical protein [Mesorhizobium sp.]MBL8580447.1 hypothetical protein [Mesorhizobium sp.]
MLSEVRVSISCSRIPTVIDRACARHWAWQTPRGLTRAAFSRTGSGAKGAYDSQALGGLGGGSPISEGKITSLPFRKSSPIGARRKKENVSASGALTIPDTHKTANGQSLPQSGTIDLPSGQQGMSSCMMDKAGPAAAAPEGEAPKGAKASPNTASNKSILPKPNELVIDHILAQEATGR